MSENTFLGELETMDLSKLEDKTFMVAISNGERNKYSFLCTSLTGPFDFYEMIEKDANTNRHPQLHAKAMICTKDLCVAPQILDENTIDYIEARCDDILTSAFIGGLLDSEEFTCEAGFNAVEPIEQQK